MKVKIEKYKNYYTCYDIAKALCFWATPAPDECGMNSEPDWVHDFGEWLTYGNVEPEPAVGLDGGVEPEPAGCVPGTGGFSSLLLVSSLLLAAPFAIPSFCI